MFFLRIFVVVYKEDVSSGGSLLGSRNRVLEGCCKGFVRILLKASEGSFLGGLVRAF